MLMEDGYKRTSPKPIHLEASGTHSRDIYLHWGFEVCISSLSIFTSSAEQKPHRSTRSTGTASATSMKTVARPRAAPRRGSQSGS